MMSKTRSYISDVGEVDSFLGQDALPSIPLPGVLPPELKKPSAEQLQPITFYNAQGQPTGGAGLDFLSPVGVSQKSSESTFLTRHKQFASRRRPVAQLTTTSSSASSLPPVPVTSVSSLKSQPAQLVAALSEPPQIEPVPLNLLTSSKLSPLLQEPTLVSKTVLLPPKSQSTPPSPSVQLPLPTSANQPFLAVSKSQPTTASSSPSHKPQASSLVSQDLSPPSEEPTGGETWSSLVAQDIKPSAPPSRYSFVQSIVTELFSATEKPEKSSHTTQFSSEPSSESVPLGSNSLVQPSEEASAHILTAPPFNLPSKAQDIPTKNQAFSTVITESSTSLTEFESLASHSGSQSPNLFDAYNSKSVEAHQTSQHHSPTTVSLISPSTAEALLSLSVGKRLSCSEVKPENLSSESIPLHAVSDTESSSLHSNHQEDKPNTVGDSGSLPNQDSNSSYPGYISSEKEVSDSADKSYSEKSFALAAQDLTLGSSHITSSEKETISPGFTETSVESDKDQSKESSRVEHIPGYKPATEGISPVPEPQLTDSLPEKVVKSEFSHLQSKPQVSAHILLGETKGFADKLEPAHFSVQEKEPNKTDSVGVSSSVTKATNFPANTDSPQSSQQPEARLPTTLELNSSNPLTPLHSLTTQPDHPSFYPGTQSFQSTPSQYFTPIGQPSQLPPAQHQEKPFPPVQFFTPKTEQSQFPLNHPFQNLPSQSSTPSNQNPSPTYSTQAYQETSLEDSQFPLRHGYQSPSNSDQDEPSLWSESVAPCFYTLTPPIRQPPVLQPPPPQSQVYDPVTTTPLSHFTTTPSTRQISDQFFTPASSHFHPPILPPPPPRGSQLPSSQASQNFASPYLIPTTQATQPAAQTFVPTVQPGQSSADQPLTPSFKTAQIPFHTHPNGLYQPGSSHLAALPPLPPSNHPLPPPPLRASATPPYQPPGQFLPPLPQSLHASPTLGPSTVSLPPPPPTSSQSQYPQGTPTLRPIASSLPPPPPKSNFGSSPNVNQYSIHAKSQHSRRHYVAPSLQPQKDYFKPSPIPPSPVVQPATPPVFQQASPATFLVPDKSSAPSLVPPPSATTAPFALDSQQANQQVTYLVPNKSPSSSPLSSVPLTPATTPPAPCNGVASPSSVASSQFPPQCGPPPAVPLPSLTPNIPPPPPKQGIYNPFSARATPPPPSSLQQKSLGEAVPPPPSSFYQPQPVPFSSPSYSEPVPLSSPAVSSLGVNQLNPSAPPPAIVSSNRPDTQGYTSDLTHSVDSVNFVPSSSSAPLPSGIPEGGPKNYRLGKQRPRYAQVPDLAVSPLAVSPVYSPSSSESIYSATPAAPEPYPIYPPGSQQLIVSEDFLVPSENSVSDQLEDIPSSLFNLATQPGSAAAAASGGGNPYHPVYCHWFFKKEAEPKGLWKPFSLLDSSALETAFNDSETNENTLVPTDGGRYDVNVSKRERTALFWEEKKPTEVRRCSWFYKGPLDSRYTPYEEDFAAKLEEEYKMCMDTNKWNRKIEHNVETVVMHGPVVMVHYSPTGLSDQLGVTADTSPVKPRVVKRGVEEFEIEEGEPAKVDHLLFLVHGIGSVCDLRFRDVVETVDDFRSLALQLTRTHFSLSVEKNQVNRVEVLPVSWHWKLHGEDTGIDRKLNSITLKSIPRLRNFTNDTLLDILFYTSPVYCQTIMDTVGNEMNRMYELFLKRNPGFHGSVSVGGHSLGSLILFDLLYHQKVPKIPRSSPSIIMTGPGTRPPDTSPRAEKQPEKNEDTEEPMEEDDVVNDEDMALAFSRSSHLHRRASRVNYMIGTAGTGQPHISYPQLNFKPENFFALGSPIGMFVTVRGIETLGDNFRLPTCPGFFNIFHPFDPVAYRIESLIDPDFAPTLKPVTIPHHKGRKRMHLELKENLQRMGSDLKNKLVDSVKNTWNTMTQFGMFSRPEPTANSTMESEVTRALEAHLGPATVSAPVDIGADTESEGGDNDADVTLGCLNRGRRVDYVLQEAPLESFNEYLFALQSHVCYWESEDTLLMILTEIYNANNVKPDSVLTGGDREKSPMRLLSDQFLASASPPKFSALRFPSSTSLSSEGSTSSQGVSRSQSVPKTLNDPNLAMLSTSSPGYLESMGQPPQMGMDPTAPISEVRNLAPPPTVGFVKQSLQRK